MRILIIGCGSIGKRHLKNLLHLGEKNIIIYDKYFSVAEQLSGETGMKAFKTLKEAYKYKPEIVFITSSTNTHFQIAEEAVENNCNLFIEKPISNKLNGLDKLLAEIDKKKLISFIGSNWKFHYSFKKIKELLDKKAIGNITSARCQFGQYLPDWHPGFDYKKGYSANKELGGGILLDSHEFDYLTWFLGPVNYLTCISGHISDLEINTEDTAEIILKFNSGTIGEIHLDYTQRAYQRNYEFFGEYGTIKWDFNERAVKMFLVDKNPHWVIWDEPRNYDLNVMYIDEVKYFMDCVKNKKKTISDAKCGVNVLKIIYAAKKSAEENKFVKMEKI